MQHRESLYAEVTGFSKNELTRQDEQRALKQKYQTQSVLAKPHELATVGDKRSSGPYAQQSSCIINSVGNSASCSNVKSPMEDNKFQMWESSEAFIEKHQIDITVPNENSSKLNGKYATQVSQKSTFGRHQMQNAIPQLHEISSKHLQKLQQPNAQTSECDSFLYTESLPGEGYQIQDSKLGPETFYSLDHEDSETSGDEVDMHSFYSTELIKKSEDEAMDNEKSCLEDTASESGPSTTSLQKCPLCCKSFMDLTRLSLHIQRIHVNPPQHRCTECGKTFGMRSRMTMHMRRVHSNEKNFCCDLCNFASKYSHEVKRHNRSVHLNERPHQCPQCDFSFTQKSHLTQHIRVVHNHDKPFQCFICEKRFADRVKMDRHWRSVHCGEKPFSCDLCTSTFTQRSNLTQHKRIVHEGIKRFLCAECKFNCSSKTQLQRHCAIVHAQIKDNNIRDSMADTCTEINGEYSNT